MCLPKHHICEFCMLPIDTQYGQYSETSVTVPVGESVYIYILLLFYLLIDT